MLHFVFYPFGKLRTPGLQITAQHYLRRLGQWAKTQIIELSPAPTSRQESSVRAAPRAVGQKQEAKTLATHLLKHQERKNPIVILDECGTALSTIKWRKLIATWEMSGSQSVVFCIGSHLGFDPALHALAHHLVSFGPQTLPHELVRVLLYEQLYRAYSLHRGLPYHRQ